MSILLNWSEQYSKHISSAVSAWKRYRCRWEDRSRVLGVFPHLSKPEPKIGDQYCCAPVLRKTLWPVLVQDVKDSPVKAMYQSRWRFLYHCYNAARDQDAWQAGIAYLRVASHNKTVRVHSWFRQFQADSKQLHLSHRDPIVGVRYRHPYPCNLSHRAGLHPDCQRNGPNPLGLRADQNRHRCRQRRWCFDSSIRADSMFVCDIRPAVD